MTSVPHPSVAERLARLAPDQRAAATAPPGPVLCVAPAGSGKTTTLVARVAWLVDGGADPGSVCIVAFNKRAAEELTARLDAALAPLGVAAGSVRVRTFHALGREILRDAGVAVEPLADRDAVLRDLFPGITRADRGRLDLAFSRLKLDLRVTADEVARDPAPGPVARAFIAYEGAVRESGGCDFDDLLVRALDEPARRTRACSRAGGRAPRGCSWTRPRTWTAPSWSWRCCWPHRRTTSSWSATTTRRSTPGAWPTCGGSSGWPPRCRACAGWTSRRTTAARHRSWPAPCGSSSTTASGSPSGSWPGSKAGGRLVLAPDAADDVVRVRRAMASWPADDTTRAVLARTNRELLVAVVAALDLGVPFRAPDLPLAIEDPRLDGLLDRAEAGAGTDLARRPTPVPSPPSAGSGRRCVAEEAVSPPDDADEATEGDLVTALLGWAAAHPSIAALREAVGERRARLAELRRDDAALTLATAHGTKGLEWDHVLVLTDGFPGRRAVGDATEPERALEEERRLAYVAWTRARRSLTLLYDPEAPSPFLLEAFDPEELAPSIRGRAA